MIDIFTKHSPFVYICKLLNDNLINFLHKLSLYMINSFVYDICTFKIWEPHLGEQRDAPIGSHGVDKNMYLVYLSVIKNKMLPTL